MRDSYWSDYAREIREEERACAEERLRELLIICRRIARHLARRGQWEGTANLRPDEDEARGDLDADPWMSLMDAAEAVGGHDPLARRAESIAHDPAWGRERIFSDLRHRRDVRLAKARGEAARAAEFARARVRHEVLIAEGKSEEADEMIDAFVREHAEYWLP